MKQFPSIIKFDFLFYILLVVNFITLFLKLFLASLEEHQPTDVLPFL